MRLASSSIVSAATTPSDLYRPCACADQADADIGSWAIFAGEGSSHPTVGEQGDHTDCGILADPIYMGSEANRSGLWQEVMRMPTVEPVPRSGDVLASVAGIPGSRAGIASLTYRQREYLRLVLQLKNSKQIAAETGSSHRAVDKQLLKANAVLGVATRFEAAQLLAAFEEGVEPLHPANALPSPSPEPTLSPPWPTGGAAVNMLTWKQVAIWATIISIVTPVGLTVAGMAFFTLLLLLRLMP